MKKLDQRFLRAVELILKHEGGYVNDPADLGGETKFGISKRSYPNVDIKNLSKEQAIEIYHRDWWQRYGYSKITNDLLATAVFDFAVNMGAGTAHRLLQQAINFLADSELTIDGVLGPLTLAACNKFERPEKLVTVLKFFVARYYHGLVIARPANGKFLLGWLNRAYS